MACSQEALLRPCAAMATIRAASPASTSLSNLPTAVLSLPVRLSNSSCSSSMSSSTSLKSFSLPPRCSLAQRARRSAKRLAGPSSCGSVDSARGAGP